MIKITRFSDFQNEQAVTPMDGLFPQQDSMKGPKSSTEKVKVGGGKRKLNRNIENLKRPSRLKTFFHLDDKEDWKINPAKTRPMPSSNYKGDKEKATSWNEYPTNRTILATKILLNPTKETQDRQIGLGWTPVWEETYTTEKEIPAPVAPNLTPFSFALDPNNDYFVLGGFVLTDIAKKIIKSEFECNSKVIQPGVVIDKITIEASTDKTRVTEKLQELLKSKGYEPTNKGLSYARADAMKEFIISLGIQISDTNFEEYKIKVEQGKEGGYDPTARYVKIDVTTKLGNPDEYKPKKQTEENKRIWYQKLSYFQRFKTTWCVDGTCRTYD